MTQAATERPSLRQRLEQERGRVWVVGHRGAMGHRPENTLASYAHALELGADWIELDVHLSRDGALIVMHDETLDRTTNGHGLVRDHSLAELKQLDAGAWFGPEYAGQRIPTLDEILEWARARDTVVDIEIKNAPLYYAGIELAVVHALERSGMSDQAIVISFDHASVKRVKELSGGRVATGVLYGCRPLEAGVPLARSAGADALLPHWAYVTAEDVARAHAEGLSVAPWASSDPDVLRSLISSGVDAIGTNHPDILRHLIASVVGASTGGESHSREGAAPPSGGQPHPSTSDTPGVAARSARGAGL